MIAIPVFNRTTHMSIYSSSFYRLKTILSAPTSKTTKPSLSIALNMPSEPFSNRPWFQITVPLSMIIGLDFSNAGTCL